MSGHSQIDPDRWLATFANGDVVKSRYPGAPEMAIQFIVDSNVAKYVGQQWGLHCRWFTPDGALHEAVFHPSEILKTDLTREAADAGA